MFKKAMVVIVIVTMLVSIMTSSFASGIEAYPKNGFRLVAQDSDSTGIAVDSEFLLETEKDYSLEEIRNVFSIDGEPAPIIEELDKNFFSIKLARPLMENSLYTFRIKTDKETTWMFQTQSTFKITGTLPAEKSVNVPVNTGIEINFSHENFTDFKEHFEITPTVKGKFEIHKKTAVFVPERLEYDTVYTVRIKKGIKLQGTNRELTEDYVFSFETESKNANATPSPDEITANIYTGRYLYDFASDEIPEVLVTYSIQNRRLTPVEIKAQMSIYAYKDFDSFFDAVKDKNTTPYWARSYIKKFVPVDNLQKVLDFEQVLNEDNSRTYGQTYIKLPQKLPEGYYILDGTWKDVRFQTFLQITNTGIYIAESNTKTLVWLNDLSTQKPIEGASIRFVGYDNVQYSGNDGVAFFESIGVPDQNNNIIFDLYAYNRYNKFMIVTTKEGKSSVLDCSSNVYFNENKYWTYFYTDRNMYKSDDTVNIWGFVKNRYSDEPIDYLTLELNSNRYDNSTPIIKQTLQLNNSFFEASINLPNLPEGYYYITLKKGDKLIINQYLRIKNYTKPSYKLEITKDKEAIFVDEQATFNIKAAFFEGTGVSDVNITYYVNAYQLNGNIASTTKKADLKGNLSVQYSPTAGDNVQGVRTAIINARATLPESGLIDASDYLQVFINDINIQGDAKIKDGKATVTAKVNKIDLERINNGTAENSYDYLGEPVANQKINGSIYKNTWIKTETGTYYDYINKTTYKSYSYKLQKEFMGDFSMTTSSDGTASYSFNAPELQDGYYTVEISSIDRNGRKISNTLYCGKVYDYSIYNNPIYTLEVNKDSYRLGERVDVSFKYGGQPLPEGSYLYFKAQNGIYDYDTVTSSSYSFNFSEEDIPNTAVYAVYFNSKTYVFRSISVNYDIQEKNLTIQASTDKDFYKPGENVTVYFNINDLDGNPVKSTVNISVVDEAFFYLQDQNVDLLKTLYTYVGSGVYFEGRSHTLEKNQDYYDYNGRVLLPADAASGGGSGENKSEPTVREDFKDTAKFITIQTDDKGRGQATFKLPDNITSWRVTLSAISEDLHAGSDKTNIIVTLPFFINYSFNTTYLEGDKPILGVNAYGNGLEENDEITFEVISSDDSNPKLTVKGKAFERINIPLWTLKEGQQDIIIKAYSDKGYSDAVKHSFNVVKSYYQIEKAVYYDVKPNMTITSGNSGYTSLVFQDKSSGMYLSDLLSLRYSYGNRIDQIVSNYTASSLIEEYFKDVYSDYELPKPSLADYQKSNGGLSLLPYSESDLELSAKLTSLVKSMVNTKLLKDYFYNNLGSTSASDKVKALYGLSVFKEPVLLELEEVAKIDNLSVKDLIYLALAYCELGDVSTAELIYKNRIYPNIEKFEPYYRVNVEKDKDDILEVTSLCAYLAAKINAPESEGLYEYCLRNYTKDILIGIEKLMYISTVLENQEPKEGKITYSLAGETKTVTVSNGSSHCISLLPSQLEDFRVVDVEGIVSVVSIFKEDVLDINKKDDEISIKRTYYYSNGFPLTSNTLKQGDIIKVRLEWNISNTAFDGTYMITDYLPSGLKPYNSYWNTEGQMIRFYAYNRSPVRYIEYYARVISPGTYTAQGPIIQGLASRDNINIGKTETVTIEATEPILTPVEDLPEPTPTPVENILYGDVNGDNEVNSIDFAYMKMYLLGITNKLPMDAKYGDLNGDGYVDSIDLALIKMYLLGYIKKFPVESMN
ncbi:dockerin type I domain-containing protein [Acetivibrio clariflavus]|uniref:dockerin type I domain-containing protein n=1 Tax=Acetivibrio clariflavus TaxID=288965 RepID=UPI0031F48B4F